MIIGINEVLQNIIYFISLFYVVFWLLVLLEENEKKPKECKELPTVSIIIPAYNEEKNIVSTINSVVSLDYPKEKIKLFVVDDGSTDKTYERAKREIGRIEKKYSYMHIQLISQKNIGKYSAVNNALQYVDTEFVATLDADSMPKKDALKKIISCFDDKKIGAVSPVLKVYNPKKNLETMQWFEYSVNHFYKSLLCKLDAIHVTPGPLSVYRKSVINEVGNFREAHKTEDMEIALRIQKSNYKIIQCNDAFVYTKAPDTIRNFYKQRHRWNYGTFMNLLDYKKMLFNKKYGDFGMFQLPIILLSGLMAITIMFLIIYDLFKSIKPNFKLLQMYNYNIIEYISSMKFNMIWLDADVRAIVTLLGFFILTLFVIRLSLRRYKERTTIRKIVPMAFYLFFYYLLLSIVWIGVLKDYLLNKGTRWDK